MVQIISTWLFQPNKHKFAKFLSSDRDGLSEGRIQVWIIQQSLILGLVLIECGDIIKKKNSLWAWQGQQWGMIVYLGASLGVQWLPLLSASLMRSQRKEASVNQHDTEKDFIKHKCVKLLLLNKSLNFSPSPSPALASKKKKVSKRVTPRFAL